VRAVLVLAMALVVPLTGVTGPVAQPDAPRRADARHVPADAPRDHVLELHGTVRTVDRGTRTLRVSHRFVDTPDTTLLMVDATTVQIDGRAGSFDDIQQGIPIRVAYQDRYGINVARRIQVTE
jgi:hypothetical protein